MEKTLILRFFSTIFEPYSPLPLPLRSVRIVDMYEYSSRCTIQEAFNLSLRVVVTYIGSFIRDQQHTAQREGQTQKAEQPEGSLDDYKIRMALSLEIKVTRRRYVIQIPTAIPAMLFILALTQVKVQVWSRTHLKKDGHGLSVYPALKKELCGCTLPYIQFFNYM